MRSKVIAPLLLLTVSAPVFGQSTAFFQEGAPLLLDGVEAGGAYEGTIDTEFRAANPTEPQFENIELSIDQFDGGFQTQGAIRFENLLVSQGGLIPDELEPDQILNAEFRFWKTSPSASDANIDFNRIVGPDTTSGAFWDEEDTWASLGGDLIPDENGLLDGDPIARDDVEAASAFDFQDNPNRFSETASVLLDPNDAPVPSNMVFTTDADSEDVFDDAWNGEVEDLARAIDVAFWRFDVTNALRDWLGDTDPNTPGTQPSMENFGWSISNDTGDGWDMVSSEVFEPLEGEFEGLDTAQFRPALAITFDTGIAREDLNGDTVVDLLDYDLLLDLIGSHLDAPIPTGSKGDFDFDRDIDLDDFKHFKENFPGGPDGLRAALAAVPEPSAVVLSLFALCGLAMKRRTRA